MLLAETVYHSNSVLSALSSTWTSKPPLAIKYSLDTGNVGGVTSLGSTMEKLLAWEKKLYEEVKVNFFSYFRTDRKDMHQWLIFLKFDASLKGK